MWRKHTCGERERLFVVGFNSREVQVFMLQWINIYNFNVACFSLVKHHSTFADVRVCLC